MGRCINRCIVFLLPSWAAHFNIHQLLLCIIMHICQTLSRVRENTPTKQASRVVAVLLLYCQWSFSKLKSLLFTLYFRPMFSSEISYSSAQNVRRRQWPPVSLMYFHRNLRLSPSLGPWRAPVPEVMGSCQERMRSPGSNFPPDRTTATLIKQMRLPGCG